MCVECCAHNYTIAVLTYTWIHLFPKMWVAALGSSYKIHNKSNNSNTIY